MTLLLLLLLHWSYHSAAAAVRLDAVAMGVTDRLQLSIVKLILQATDVHRAYLCPA